MKRNRVQTSCFVHNFTLLFKNSYSFVLLMDKVQNNKYYIVYEIIKVMKARDMEQI